LFSYASTDRDLKCKAARLNSQIQNFKIRSEIFPNAAGFQKTKFEFSVLKITFVARCTRLNFLSLCGKTPIGV